MRRDRQQLRKGMIALMRSEANLMGIELLDLAYMAEQKGAPPNRDGVHFHRKVGFAFLNVAMNILEREIQARGRQSKFRKTYILKRICEEIL